MAKYNKEKKDWIYRLQGDNIKKLKELGKYPLKPTDGEEAVARSLRKMGIRYIPEYVTKRLEGDNHSYRIADFYLPKEDIYVEHLGNWESGESHKKRYKQKMAVYH